MIEIQKSLYDRLGGKNGLALLLRHFYFDIQQHAMLGPIFTKRISNWPEHLEKIGAFWARVTGGPSDYSGQVPSKHIDLGIDATHFDAWLDLWNFNCRAHLAKSEAEEMIILAREIGRRLSRMVTGARTPLSLSQALASPGIMPPKFS